MLAGQAQSTSGSEAEEPLQQQARAAASRAPTAEKQGPGSSGARLSSPGFQGLGSRALRIQGPGSTTGWVQVEARRGRLPLAAAGAEEHAAARPHVHLLFCTECTLPAGTPRDGPTQPQPSPAAGPHRPEGSAAAGNQPGSTLDAGAALAAALAEPEPSHAVGQACHSRTVQQGSADACKVRLRSGAYGRPAQAGWRTEAQAVDKHAELDGCSAVWPGADDSSDCHHLHAGCSNGAVPPASVAPFTPDGPCSLQALCSGRPP